MENNIKWMGHAKMMLEMQKKILKHGKFFDVKLIFEDGEYLFAHKVILASCSDFFRELLMNVPPTTDRETVIIIPDVKKNIMQKIIDFLYLGEVQLKSKNFEHFLDTCKLLSINTSSFEGRIENFDNLVIKENTKQKSLDYIINETDIIEDNLENNEEGCMELDKPNHSTIKTNISRKAGVHKIYLNPKERRNSEQDSTVANEFDVTRKQLLDECEVLENDEVYSLKEDEIFYGITVDDEEVNSTNSDILDLVFTEEEVDASEIEAEPSSTITNDANEYDKIQTDREQKLNMAANEIKQAGLTLAKAAIKYNIPKTVLWRRMRRDPTYGHKRYKPLLELARVRLEKGETMKSICESLNIPKSALLRYKFQLVEQGLLPETYIRRREQDKAALKKKFEKALRQCRKGVPVNKVAIEFGISKSTLWRHFKRSEFTSGRHKEKN